jgi:hypothetical protein
VLAHFSVADPSLMPAPTNQIWITTKKKAFSYTSYKFASVMSFTFLTQTQIPLVWKVKLTPNFLKPVVKKFKSMTYNSKAVQYMKIYHLVHIASYPKSNSKVQKSVEFFPFVGSANWEVFTWTWNQCAQQLDN